MLHKLLLVECVEMARESLRYNGVNHWLACSRAGIQLEGLIGLLISSLKLKLLRLILRYSKAILIINIYLNWETVEPAPGWPMVSTSFCYFFSCLICSSVKLRL